MANRKGKMTKQFTEMPNAIFKALSQGHILILILKIKFQKH